MDKFGVFNILNSLFSLTGQSEPSKTNEKKPFTLDNLLSTITENLNKNSKPEVAKKQDENKKVFAPLQTSMLSTMHSHDAFVKRVKEKNKV